MSLPPPRRPLPDFAQHSAPESVSRTVADAAGNVWIIRSMRPNSQTTLVERGLGTGWLLFERHAGKRCVLPGIPEDWLTCPGDELLRTLERRLSP